ncbi:Ribosomal protein L10 [Operophtera brumata]|uniref:Ribosomal protein L10 n=1 Tax=Operophtera brumata TaxID=104452 RepID=A0A0L7K3Q1_OPEBR|nr:Ribosomal protein L10 [Operophtera brumata]
MLSCAGADRLQTGMRGAFGKPQGTVARVRIGQPIMSVRSTDKWKAAVIEALRRAKFKFPGRQKIYISKRWGFTKYDREEYEKLRDDGRLTNDGCNVKYQREHGPLAAWKKLQTEILNIYISKRWGFTKYDREEYEKLRDDGRLTNDGCNVKYQREHGPLAAWKKLQTEILNV